MTAVVEDFVILPGKLLELVCNLQEECIALVQ